MNHYDFDMIMILIEGGIITVDEAEKMLHAIEIEQELKKTSLGKELF